MVLITLGVISWISGFFAPIGIDTFARFWEAFKSARADSTRVRNALNRIALSRWQTEAPIWGHGIVDRGGHVVEWMPIGSHHTWLGLLFVKGIVGLFALAVPMLVTVVVLVRRSSNPRYQLASVGLGLSLVLLLYTFGENLEILVYLYWPGMIILGSALQERRAVPLDAVPQAPVAMVPVHPA